MADIATNLTVIFTHNRVIPPNVSHHLDKTVDTSTLLFFFQTKVDYLKLQNKYFLNCKCMHFVK